MDLRQIREKYRYSLTAFAKMCNIPISTMWKYEQNIHLVRENRLIVIDSQLEKIGATEEEIKKVNENFFRDQRRYDQYYR